MLLGITYRQLDYWSTKLLNRRTGSGKPRNFNSDEVLTLANIWVLAELGLKPGTALEVAGSPVIQGMNCLVTVDLGQLRRDIDQAIVARKPLRDTITQRVEEGAA